MIYTLTVNPAVDYHMDLVTRGFVPGEINRSEREEMVPGGKGLNVSVILSRLGIQNMAWGFSAGKTGRLLEELAEEQGVTCDFIRLAAGETRINVKLDCEKETAINGNGPAIGADQMDELLTRVGSLTREDILILSGNLQQETGYLYRDLCTACRQNGTEVVVDTEGRALLAVFAEEPFLIKPNREELLALFKTEDDSLPGLIRLMQICREEGVRNVLLTMGRDGALLLTEDGGLYQAFVETNLPVVSTVGAGDSTIAGYLAGLRRFSGDPVSALQLACAAGTATARTKWLAGRREIEAVLPQINVQKTGWDI